MNETPFGRYRLTELLGRGGMGEVWRAYDTAMDRVVALKVLPAIYADDRLFQERFRREAKAAAGLDEPHIVPIYEFGEIDGKLFVTMRLIRGNDLQVLLERGPLEPGRAISIVEQIASALNSAHEIGLVHRDVKPSNILVARDDFAYLIDFGIARAAGEAGLTSTGATVGTWAYMAPERFRTGAADARADIYSLACVLYQSLTGSLPFPGNSLEQIALAHMLDSPPRPSTLRQGVNAALDEVIATGMAKDPNQRYVTSQDLAQAARAAWAAPTPKPGSPRTVDAASFPTQASQAEIPTHAASTVSAANPKEQQSTLAGSDDGSPAARLMNSPSLEVQPPGPQRSRRRSKLVLSAIALCSMLGIAAVASFIGNQSSSGGGVALSTPTTSEFSSFASSALATTTSTKPAGDPLARRLMSLIPSDLSCSSEGPRMGSARNSVATAHCTGAGLEVVWYALYADRATMNVDFDSNSGATSSSVTLLPCPGSGQSQSRWRSPTTSVQLTGEVVCREVRGYGPQVLWTVDEQLVSAWALGQTDGGLEPVYRWWTARYK